MPTAKHTLKAQGPARMKPDSEISPNYMMNKDGLWLHWRMFSPFDPAGIKAIVVLVHGLAEHHGRYEGVAQWLNDNGYLVFMLESQGHGGSEGDRKHVRKFVDYVDDHEQFINEIVLKNVHVTGRFSHCPKLLVAHSMGGLIATNVALRMPSTFSCLCMTAPLLGIDEKVATPFLKSVAGKLSNWSPKTKVGSLDLNEICSYALTREHYAQDPLISPEEVSARLANEIMLTVAETKTHMSTITMPVSVHHGEDDRICDTAGSEFFVKTVGSMDKKLKFYPGLRHEILYEVKAGRDEVKQDMMAFLDRIVAGGAKVAPENTEEGKDNGDS